MLKSYRESQYEKRHRNTHTNPDGTTWDGHSMRSCPFASGTREQERKEKAPESDKTAAIPLTKRRKRGRIFRSLRALAATLESETDWAWSQEEVRQWIKQPEQDDLKSEPVFAHVFAEAVQIKRGDTPGTPRGQYLPNATASRETPKKVPHPRPPQQPPQPHIYTLRKLEIIKGDIESTNIWMLPLVSSLEYQINNGEWRLYASKQEMEEELQDLHVSCNALVDRLVKAKLELQAQKQDLNAATFDRTENKVYRNMESLQNTKARLAILAFKIEKTAQTKRRKNK